MKRISLIFGSLILVLLTIAISINIFNEDLKKGFLGHMYLQVLTTSMDGEEQNYKIKTLKVDEFILVDINDGNDFYSNLEVGDVITFKMNKGPMNGNIVTHRIILISYNEESNIYTLTTKGDKNKDDNIEILNSKLDTIYGEVVYSNLIIGKTLNVITNKIFLILTILVPCLFISIFEVCNIYFAFKYKDQIKEKEKRKGD